MKNPATYGFSVPTTCSLTDGHRLNKPRASNEQAVGIE